jgi:hypothetical protein
MSSFRDKATAFASRYSRVIVIVGGGVTLGLLLTFTTIWVLDLLFAPPVPSIETASAQEVAAFLAHKRGFARLPMDERRRMLFDLWASDKQEELSDEFARMSSTDRNQVRNAAFDVGLDQLVRDAKVYNSLPSEQREEYVEEFLDHQEELREELRGLGDSFKDGLPTKQDQWTKMLVSRTSASNRAKVKPLVDHLISASENRRTVSKAEVRRRGRSGNF